METATQRLPQHVDDELRRELNESYTWWRGERNPDDGDIIDWLKGLPWSMHQFAECDYDTYSEMWRAWLEFCIWFTKQNRLLVAEAAQKKEMAQWLKAVHEIERAARAARAVT